ncbi:MAG: hypothetical protein GX483_08980 [Actinomycetaceae bacterium]|nr:hypothetical protein [Actinomycetaceae bacterium]
MSNIIELDNIEELEDMLVRINAFIVPNVARTELEKEAVRKAAAKQIVYEKQLKESFSGKDIPPNVDSFKIGNFAMSFNQDQGTLLNKKNISPVAYAILFNAGLLYRGVQ